MVVVISDEDMGGIFCGGDAGCRSAGGVVSARWNIPVLQPKGTVGRQDFISSPSGYS